MKNIHHHIIRDAVVILISAGAAVYLGRSVWFENFLTDSAIGASIFGAFLSGFFFTTMFTFAPAGVALAELSQIYPVFWVAFFGAAGAVLADYLVFRLVRDWLSADISYILKIKKIESLLHYKTIHYAVPFLGALIIALPMPDELGVAMLGFSRTKPFLFGGLLLVIHFFGILALGSVAGLL